MSYNCGIQVFSKRVTAVKFRLHAFAFTLLMFLVSSAAAWACGDPCGKPTPWDDFNVFTIKVTQSGQAAYALWRGQLDKESDDIQIEAEMSDGEAVKTGTILMVGGRVMATKGDITTLGYEIDALDAPVLQRLLVIHLLGAIMPNGPAGLNGTQKIDFSESKTGIQLATQSAKEYFAAPWHVNGTVTSVKPDVIDFDLQLTATTNGPSNKGKAFVATFTGQLSKKVHAELGGTISLDGWKLFGLGIQTTKSDTTTTSDYNAAPTAPQKYKTIADIRKKLAADDYPGERNATKNFTGYWKEKCDNSVGLQIMHQGSDGKYSIAVCANRDANLHIPGGCGDTSITRKTFFTGDRHYQVMSEEKIVELYDSAPSKTLIRCSKDPNAWQKPSLGSHIK